MGVAELNPWPVTRWWAVPCFEPAWKPSGSPPGPKFGVGPAVPRLKTGLAVGVLGEAVDALGGEPDRVLAGGPPGSPR
jgi:hypothetical protein